MCRVRGLACWELSATTLAFYYPQLHPLSGKRKMAALELKAKEDSADQYTWESTPTSHTSTLSQAADSERKMAALELKAKEDSADQYSYESTQTPPTPPHLCRLRIARGRWLLWSSRQRRTALTSTATNQPKRLPHLHTFAGCG